jgi:endonuclease YncB( thermonuclease family)
MPARRFVPLRVLALLLPLLVVASPAGADWLVYTGGGVEEVKGAWEVKRGQVVFTAANGTLMGVRVDDVDLAASAFLTWQVGERRGISAKQPPAGTEMRVGGATAGPAKEAPCVEATVVSVLEAETIEVAAGAKKETVHLACVDAPGTQHQFPALSGLGADAREKVELLARPGFKLCLAEEIPALVDRSGHRVVYARLPDGRDLGAELIARGLALARSGGCARQAAYVALQKKAITELAGHWDDARDDLAEVIAQATPGGVSKFRPAATRGARRS